MSFEFRGRIKYGNFRLQCPNCGHIGKYRFTEGQFSWKCHKCRRVWIIGLVLRRVPNNGGRPLCAKDDKFPIMEVSDIPWRSGDPIHKVIDELEPAPLASPQPSPNSHVTPDSPAQAEDEDGSNANVK